MSSSPELKKGTEEPQQAEEEPPGEKTNITSYLFTFFPSIFNTPFTTLKTAHKEHFHEAQHKNKQKKLNICCRDTILGGYGSRCLVVVKAVVVIVSLHFPSPLCHLNESL